MERDKVRGEWGSILLKNHLVVSISGHHMAFLKTIKFKNSTNSTMWA